MAKPNYPRSPSISLLSILANIVAEQNVHAGPPPPAFLCPSLTQPRRRSPSPSIDPGPSTRHVPERYAKDEDGMWRRVPSYTLYGSTVSSCSGTSCRQPTTSASTVDDNIQIPSSAADNSTTGSIEDSLPPGWKPVNTASQGRTMLILSLSLVLAFLICFFIIGCLFWRKTVKKRYKDVDVEARARRRRESPPTPTQEDISEKAKQKLWARATARWRANVRYTARQRRGKRNLTSSRLSSSRTHLPSSRMSSPRSSTVSIHESRPSISASPLPSSPPAYRRPSSGHTSPYLARSRRHSRSSSSTPSELFLSPALHVATDDKTLLARLADFASAPPQNSQSDPGPSESHVLSSAPPPDWDEDDILSDLEALTTRKDYDPSSTFPPPPSKERLACYDYSFSYEELEPELGPSAPPFEEQAPLQSEPHLQADLVPSAPPLLDAEDDYYADDMYVDAVPIAEHQLGDDEGEGGGDGVVLRRSTDRPEDSPSINDSSPSESQTMPSHVLPGYRP